MKLLIVAVLISLLPSLPAAAQSLSDTDGGFVTLQDVPILERSLRSTGKDGSFFVLLVPGTAKNDGYAANLQFSIERNKVGLDWVLIAERNIEDEQKFMREVREDNSTLTKEMMNDVRYLRVTDSKNLIRLATSVLTDIYGVKPDEKMQLIVTGFEWPVGSGAFH
jgi:hypothetical protein